MWPFPDLPVQNGRKPWWLNVAIAPGYLEVQPQNAIAYYKYIGRTGQTMLYARFNTWCYSEHNIMSQKSN